jgi:hypothetical protein
VGRTEARAAHPSKLAVKNCERLRMTGVCGGGDSGEAAHHHAQTVILRAARQRGVSKDGLRVLRAAISPAAA